MFAKLASLLALALALPLVSALSLNIPESITSEGWTTITWTPESGDKPFNLYLVHEEFNDSYAIANNVDPARRSINIFIPPVPIRDGYSLNAINVTNMKDVYSATGTFTVTRPTESANPTIPPATMLTSSTTESESQTSTSSSSSPARTSAAPAPLGMSGASSVKAHSGLVAAALAGAAAFAVVL